MKGSLGKVRAHYWLCFAALLEFASGQLAFAAEAPHYEIEPCCELCPETQLESTYAGGLGEFNKLIAGQDGWLFRSKTELLTQMRSSPEGYAQLRQLRDALQAKGVELMVVYVPTRGMVNAQMLTPAVRQSFDVELAKRNYLEVVENLRKQGIRVPDLTPLLAQPASAEKPLFFKRDHHWTAYGAEFTARLVAEELRKFEVFKTIPRKEFVTQSKGMGMKLGTLNGALNKICGYRYASQYLPRFSTEPKEESTDLFGEVEAPAVVLGGTSFGSPQYNFDGFIEQYANVDVDNRSVSGGGMPGAIVQYLSSQDFKTHPPKILIWEVQSYYDLAMPVLYRQLLPILANGCDNTAVTLSQKVALHPGTNQILVNAEVKEILNDHYIADIQFSNPEIKELQSTFWYMNGSKENLRITRSREVEADGRFVFRLNDGITAKGRTLLSLEVEMPQQLPAGLEVVTRICPRTDKINSELQAAAH
ncbi:MAG: alginate biosynthesis protein AlgX [Pseudomonas sp.]|uniref:alginate O-acetyltransferase AlgX-related protein n=1 Tax=Pseudomonas sp. TaxID=306 RepID=UPI002733D23D|nr:alginate biosynthesis protein AlgX [Pseudomonas sp.]MDP3845018.1 alginate biosynthesis protein AlgX [Pseudomonas sp.]